VNDVPTSGPRRAQAREQASSTFPPLRVERAVIPDMPDGRPLPPLGADWRVVRRMDGNTFWCRLRLSDTRD
jgi:hypothetical protein